MTGDDRERANIYRGNVKRARRESERKIRRKITVSYLRIGSRLEDRGMHSKSSNDAPSDSLRKFISACQFLLGFIGNDKKAAECLKIGSMQLSEKPWETLTKINPHTGKFED